MLTEIVNVKGRTSELEEENSTRYIAKEMGKNIPRIKCCIILQNKKKK